MEYYTLQGDEVVLFKGNAKLNGGESAVDVVLTNLFIVFIKKTESEDTAEIETHAVDSIKIYRDTHWIKQNAKIVEIYFRECESVLDFSDKKTAREFVSQTLNVLTGKNAVIRGLEKTKKAVNEVDDALGIDSVEIAKKGGKALFGRFLKKDNTQKTEKVKQLKDGWGRKKEKPAEIPEISSKGQVQFIKDLKELLDMGAITQEEFDQKKKEILGV